MSHGRYKKQKFDPKPYFWVTINLNNSESIETEQDSTGIHLRISLVKKNSTAANIHNHCPFFFVLLLLSLPYV